MGALLSSPRQNPRRRQQAMQNERSQSPSRSTRRQQAMQNILDERKRFDEVSLELRLLIEKQLAVLEQTQSINEKMRGKEIDANDIGALKEAKNNLTESKNVYIQNAEGHLSKLSLILQSLTKLNDHEIRGLEEIHKHHKKLHERTSNATAAYMNELYHLLDSAKGPAIGKDVVII